MSSCFLAAVLGAALTSTAIKHRDSGFGFSGGAFDQFLAKQTEILDSVGRRVAAYVHGGASLPTLEGGWCDAAYWFHEGMAEPRAAIAVAKLETAIEVLLAAESTSRSTRRFHEAIKAFYGLKPTDPLGTDPSITVKDFVKEIVGARSRVLHGTLPTLTANLDSIRANVEFLGFDLLRRSSLILDRYSTQANPDDTVEAFLRWIDSEHVAGRAG